MLLPTGGILIDNPGIREVHMWTDETTLRNRFTDIANLAALCRFHDCKHGADAGCAIRTALSEGRLDSARFEGFLKLDDEIEELRRSRSKRRMTVERIARREQRERAKRFADRRQHDYEPEPR
jgi:ribosome biogenesis GTPase